MKPFWTHSALTLALVSAFALATPAAISAAPVAAQDLTLEKLYPAKAYGGQIARAASFSKSGRYVAYLWNPYGVQGSDLYVHDTQTGKTQRITSLEWAKSVEAPERIDRFVKKEAQKIKEEAERQAQVEAQARYLKGEQVDLSVWEREAIEQLKKQQAERKARQDKAVADEKAFLGLAAAAAPAASGASAPAKGKDAGKEAGKDAAKDKEEWEWRDELKKQQDKDKLKAGDLYPGVEHFVWARQADELIFQYRGDLFRLQVSSGKVERLTLSERGERVLSYTEKDDGYVFQDESRVMRAYFHRGGVQQLARELIHPDDAERKYRIAQTTLTRDQKFMGIWAEFRAEGDRGREVEIMNYNGRWATAKKVPREVSDDKRKEPALALYIRKVGTQGNEAQPEPVFTAPGGDVWFEVSELSWSKDGSRYAFATWERERDVLRIYAGKAEEGVKPELVLERRGNVGHEVVSSLAPKFTPDGKTLVAVLDEGGFRQPYVIDTEKKGVRPIVKGDFEAHNIVGFSSDSQHLYVLSNKGDFAAMNLFRVRISDGEMTALGVKGEYTRSAALTEDGRLAAVTSGNWAKRAELKLVDAAKPGDAKVITSGSHNPAWDDLNIIKPERTSFKNRHGDTIEAYVFKPQGWKATDRRPAILYVYGGPLGDRHTVELDSYQPTAYVFGMYMAAKHGYVTIAVDPRGQSNYGRRFSDFNFEQVGVGQTEDLVDATKFMSSQLGVDASRIGLTGWSFGGFQTQHAMYTQPDVFAAGIAGAGPTEWENYNSWYTGRTIGKLERNKPVLRKYSLLPLAKGLRKPLMLVHGMQDPNVLYQDTVNVYRALLEAGKESLVDLFLDPDGDHGMGGAVKAKGWHKKYEAYFLQHLGSGKP